MELVNQVYFYVYFPQEAKRTKHLREAHGIVFKTAEDDEDEDAEEDGEELVDDDLESEEGDVNNDDGNETQEVIVYVDKNPGEEAS